MFCPKCGTKNPEDGRFCRSCGADISSVPAAMGGMTGAILNDLGLDGCGTESSKRAIRRTDPAEVYGDGIRSAVMGVGFLIISMALLLTGVANGRTWWWAMLFPAFTFLGKGISDVMKSRRMMVPMGGGSMMTGASLNAVQGTGPTTALPPRPADLDIPQSRYSTGDLAPHSVTDETTRQLNVRTEGETLTLPKS
jgi:hypothetical protein